MTQLPRNSSNHTVPRQMRMITATLAIVAAAPFLSGQAITIDTKAGNGPVIDRRYTQIEPTKVSLPDAQIDAHGHQDILRSLTAEQGFAMRPIPRGKKGLTLVANGKLSPSGQGYVSAVTEQGMSVKPGDRVVLSNIRIDKEKIVFDLNGGPEHKHEFLRHIQIGAGGPTNPIVQDSDQEPTGSRVTLSFQKYVPEVTPAQVKALLAPLISFDIKTPVQAYTDTLPPKLKSAILNHTVLVGMNTDMVLFAMGQPESKSREQEGQMPFEEWIYGHPPQDVNFVRVNGNRVIRVEVAKLGQPLEIFTKDEVTGLLMTDGKPVQLEASATHEHKIELGDVHPDLDKQAAAAPPTLRAPGEKLPADTSMQQDPRSGRVGPMKPVIFPKDTSSEPARTVPAHPKPAAPADDDDADDPKPVTAQNVKNPDAAKPPVTKPQPARAPYTPAAPQTPADTPTSPSTPPANLLPATSR